MSTEAVTWVKNLDYDACALGPFRVLLILAEHANSEGKRAFRSKKKIARTLGVSERSVQRWYVELIDRGLIVPGDQSYVSHIPANQRPVVYNLCMAREPFLVQLELPEELGETGLSTGLLGETAVVAVGETAVVGSRNQVLEPGNSSSNTSHSTHARMNEDAFGGKLRPAVASAEACPTHRAGHVYVRLTDTTCSMCGMHRDQVYDPASGEIHWRETASA